MLHHFNDETLKVYLENLGEDDKQERYSVGQLFVPLTPTFVLDERLIETSTGSLFVENSLMKVIATSKNIPSMIEDLTRQLDRVLTTNIQVALTKVNSPKLHNRILRENLLGFQNFLVVQIFQHNIPLYLRQLATALVAVRRLKKLGLDRWGEIYNAKVPNNLDNSARMELMETLFEVEINQEIDSLAVFFKSRPVRLKEKTPYEITRNI